MNRLIKAASKVEVDPEAMEKLLVNRSDFLHALENDIKPVSLKFLHCQIKVWSKIYKLECKYFCQTQLI
jgi:hypothetical protein